ncbi:hypothetical protein BAUCODRAFT_200000 [Baudoinia panamericana UAMH 10762]|uniref:ferric-chelate reductase (NADPH) n=1 Tax=Baudoinia panamericana (strain UAMH 10762) TaxID=717646 RepID=M2NAB4_BAUPA|nr:uncharacterized protein BAUCODRAFT_200000 [Baudoinia panamericana UAMH 10762]EMD01164.1 hypothetical protein BAUCODRAFT_200000 [Baudoinia panamericana UAMH 10762]
MGWAYRFLDLTQDQKQHRRQLLDTYAAVAQVSVIIPLLIAQCYFFATWLMRRSQHRSDNEPPRSPHGHNAKHDGSRAYAVLARKVSWWLSDPLDLFGYHVGTKGELIGAFIWTSWLLTLCFLQSGDDYLHLTKRFGIVAASQLPLHYLLAFKSPYFPLQTLTRCSHETLNKLHQQLGRIVTFLLYLHAAFYIYFYVQKDILSTKIKEAYVLCGIVGILAFSAVGTTALAPVRRWSYRVFYMVHVSLATALLPVLFFHVSHIRVYLYETALLYAGNIVLRALASRTFFGSIRMLPDTNLIEVDVPLQLTVSGARKSWSSVWQPGQHAYLSLAGHPMLRTFRSNPFTVASLPLIDGYYRFVAKVLDGNTAKLAQAADADKVASKIPVTVEGPYGLASHGERLLEYDRVLLVAGGVGATFIVPLYRQLLADLSPSKGSYRRQKVSFLWTVRSKAEITWAIPEDSKDRESFLERLNVCITGSADDLGSTVNGSFAIGAAEEDKVPYGETDDGIELEEQKQLLSSKAESGVRGAADTIPTFAGRPNVARVVDQLFSHGAGAEKVAVVVCGPRSLSQALRRELRKWVWRAREVWFWEESFAL